MTIRKMIIGLILSSIVGLITIAIASYSTIYFHKENTQTTINTIEHINLAVDAQRAFNNIKHIVQAVTHDIHYDTGKPHNHLDKRGLLKVFKQNEASLYHLLPLLYLPRYGDEKIVQEGDKISDELYELTEQWLDKVEFFLRQENTDHEQGIYLENLAQDIELKFIHLFNIINQNSKSSAFTLNKKAEEASYISLAATTSIFFFVSLWLFISSRKLTNRLLKLISTINHLATGDTQTKIPYTEIRGDIGSIAKAAETFKLRMLELKKINRNISYIANHDLLTKTANRRHLNEHFDTLEENDKKHFYLFQLDLDDFKAINDYYGHQIGDEVLTFTANTIKINIEPTDFLARTGGNEFVLLIDHRHYEYPPESLAERLVKSINTPISRGKSAIIPNINIGISQYGTDGKTLEELINNSSIALQDVKKYRRNSYLVVSKDLKEQAENAQHTLDELHHALDNKHIVPFFQPQLCLKNNHIRSFEALARWIHPEKGILTPMYFIEDASPTELIERIGEAILDASIEALKTWDNAGLPEATISINVSYRELSNPNFYENVMKKLLSQDIATSRISFEVLETVAVNNNNYAILKNLSRLYDYGINLHVDDFGIGYSSVSNLQQSNFQKIKIDQSFVCNEDSTNKDKVLLKSIIGLAKSLRINSLLEGVETPEELELAEHYGCDQVQGYLIAKPQNLEDITQWWQKNLRWKENEKGEDEAGTEISASAPSMTTNNIDSTGQSHH